MRNVKIHVVVALDPLTCSRIKNTAIKFLGEHIDITLDSLIYLGVNELSLNRFISGNIARGMDTLIPMMYPNHDYATHCVIQEAVMNTLAIYYKQFFEVANGIRIPTPAQIESAALGENCINVVFSAFEEEEFNKCGYTYSIYPQ